jgi:hypothetical protein
MNASALSTSLLVFGAILGSSSCREITKKSAMIDTTSSARSSMHRRQAPDIVGTITIMDSSSDRPLVWVEADPADPTVNGRGTPKAEISNFFQVSGRENARKGCVVSVWYDESFAIVDMYPEIIVADSIALVGCK